MKKVLIIGGGASGLMAAIAAAEQGAKVTLLEKNKHEFQRGHIIGSVNLLPTEIKNQNVGKIEHHKEKPLIIVDVNGVSSATSAELLTKQGFEKVYVLKDGLAAWAGANLPLVKKHK